MRGLCCLLMSKCLPGVLGILFAGKAVLLRPTGVPYASPLQPQSKGLPGFSKSWDFDTIICAGQTARSQVHHLHVRTEIKSAM